MPFSERSERATVGCFFFVAGTKDEEIAHCDNFTMKRNIELRVVIKYISAFAFPCATG